MPGQIAQTRMPGARSLAMTCVSVITAAFDALENFPVLSESRNRVLRLVREKPGAVGEVVSAIESDVARGTTFTVTWPRT